MIQTKMQRDDSGEDAVRNNSVEDAVKYVLDEDAVSGKVVERVEISSGLYCIICCLVG